MLRCSSYINMYIKKAIMSNLNYSLLKDYVIFTEIDPSTMYYLQGWEGLGLAGEDVATGSPYGTIYNPSDVLTYNTLSTTFIIDEDWKTFDKITSLALGNAPTNTEDYNPNTTDIDLYVMNNTYKKPVGYFRMSGAYVQSIMNITQAYNTEDNTIVHTMTVIWRYQYHKFYRSSNE